MPAIQSESFFEIGTKGRVEKTSSPDELAEIYHSANNLVIWQRTKRAVLSEAVEGLVTQNQSLKRLPLQIEEHVTPESVRDFLTMNSSGIKVLKHLWRIWLIWLICFAVYLMWKKQACD